MQQIWKQPAFRWYWTGLFLSGLGDQFGWLALTWFVMKKTGSSVAMGGVVLTYFWSQVAAGLVAGVLLDRFERRNLIIMDNLLRGAIYLGLVALLQGNGPLWPVFLLIALAGMLAPLSNAGSQALLPRLVPDKEMLLKANSLMESQWQIAYLLGPALAGLLVSWYGEAQVLILDAISFFVCAACFFFIPKAAAQPDRNPDGSREETVPQTAAFFQALLSDLRTGYRYLFARPILLWLIFFVFLFNMAYGPVEVALPFYARDALQGEAVSLGMLWMALAVGSLCGSLLFSFLEWRIPTGYTLAGIIVLWGIATLPLGLCSRLDIALLSMALAGLAFAPFGVLYRTYLQRQVPEELLGRVFTSIRTITGTGMPFGAFVSGLLIPELGVNRLLLLGALVCMLAGGVAFRQLRGIRP
ncbi:MFS transporter [Brevibacillus sp. SYP-B805]|uniref:MFS transporter n=1 Tax=Brevibacillus sp. SYP-B805 TaxID=1578199 RepID=UPI0013EBC128|nr:MFS transporter [Brevibacillus sp. SYP-B805]NGQ97290.1 MFS transporter [Brevibacillus sp. SYP-B805]